MACGRFDLQVGEAAFWCSAFGKSLTPEQLVKMHPLRSRELEEAKPVEVSEAESKVAWGVLFGAFGVKPKNIPAGGVAEGIGDSKADCIPDGEG